jgi:hypothetical protein
MVGNRGLAIWLKMKAAQLLDPVQQLELPGEWEGIVAAGNRSGSTKAAVGRLGDVHEDLHSPTVRPIRRTGPGVTS